MTDSQTCPEADRLQALLTGTLSEADQQALGGHIEGCPHCQEALDCLAATSWEKKVKGFGSPDASRGAGLRAVMAAARASASGEATQAESQGAEQEAFDFLSPSEEPGHLGRFGPYEILELLGKGGFGLVFRAFDPKLRRVVAIKVLSPQLAGSGLARQRFRREAQAAAAVVHDHVVTIHAVDEANGVPYLVMQCIDGISLQDKLQKSGPLQLKEILRIGSQAACGLAAAHKQGLIHRDIKPANILLENGVERVKITDFGMARAVDDASVSQSGVIAGTPQYMSPEQAAGEHLDHRSDLFSLGTVLYAMCTGRPPFRATGTVAVLKRVCEETPRPIREINSEIPDWLCDIIAKLHAKKPEDRYQTATEVAELLEQHLAGVQQPVKPAPVVSAAHHGNTLFPPRVVYGTALTILGIELLLVGATLLDDAWNLRSTFLVGHAFFACLTVALAGLASLMQRAGHPRRSLLPARAAIFCAVLSVALVVALVVTSLTGSKQSADDRNASAPGPGDKLPAVEADWVQLFNGKDLTGWKTHTDQPGDWKVEDGLLVGRAIDKPTHLFTERGDFENFHFRVEARINSDGDSGQYFRCEYGLNDPHPVEKGPFGYEANISFLNEFKTGSLWGAGWPPVGPKESLIVPDTWFTQEVIADTNHIVIKVNGKTTVDFVDKNHKYQRGHLALQAWALGTIVQFKKIEIKELPPTPAAAQPFVILAKAGGLEKAFATLKDAVAAVKSGDTIEIRGNGPFVTEPLRMPDGKHLLIRAAQGFHPVLQANPSTPGETYIFHSGIMANSLTLEGLELRRSADCVSEQCHLVEGAGPIRILNCRLVVDGPGNALNPTNNPEVEIENCQLIATSYSAVVWYPPWVAPFKGRLTLRNNVFIAANQYNGVGLYVGYGKAQLGVNLKLNDNTFVNTVPIQVGFLDRPQEPKPLLQRPLQWKLTNNVSDGRNCFLSIRNLKPDEFPDQDVPSFMQKHFAWDEAQHVHGEYHTFLRIDKKKSVPTELGLMSLDSWQKWWGLPPNGSLQGEIRFSGGDLLAKCKSSPLGITPADCRLAVHSTGHGAGPGGKDLGADVDRVGPAKAYEAWKKTPAYQQWRKKTEELMDK